MGRQETELFPEEERRVYSLISKNSGITAREIGRLTGIEKKAVSRLLVSSVLRRDEVRFLAALACSFDGEVIAEQVSRRMVIRSGVPLDEQTVRCLLRTDIGWRSRGFVGGAYQLVNLIITGIKEI